MCRTEFSVYLSVVWILHILSTSFDFRAMENTRKVMSLPIFFQLLLFTCIVVFALFSLNQPGSSNSEKVISIQNTIWQLIVWFICCHLSEKIAAKSFSISDDLYNLNWLMLSKRERRMVWFMISRAQKEFRFTCLGMFDCSLETFSIVISHFIEYFLCHTHLILWIFQWKLNINYFNAHLLQTITKVISYYLFLRNF